MFTNSVNHLTKSQMKSLLKEEATTLWDDGAADHLERCSECRQAVEAMAAAPDLWQRAGELCSPAVGASLSTDQRTKPLHLSADTDAPGSSFNPELS